MRNEFSDFYAFGDYRFDSRTNTLWRGTELVPLAPKALELLKLLLEKEGSLISKREILETVWAETFVEEGVLTQNIYTLRKTLGTDENGKQYIENIARRGYRFAAEVRSEAAAGDRFLSGEKSVRSAPETAIASAENRPPAATPAGKTFFQRRRLSVLTAAAAILLSIAGLIFYRLPPNRPASALRSQPAGEMQFQRLTDTGDIAYLTISPDGEFVAFNRGEELYLKDVKSNSEIKLNVENLSRISCLQFSADSSFIFFGSSAEPNSPGKVFRVSRLGGSARLIAENVWSGFSFSPDGRRLAFHRKYPNDNRWTLVLKDTENGAETELAPRILPEQYYWNNYPAWSADGARIAAVSVSLTEHFLRLLIIDVAGGEEKELKTQNFRNVEQAVWSADGRSLVASANDGKNFQLWRIAYPGGETRRITNDLNSYLGLSITRDGKKLLARQRTYYSNIWSGSRADLGNMRQLTVGTSRNDGLRGLAWLDGSKIIYSSNAEKLRDWNLWLVDVNDRSRQEITFDDETQNEEPAVAPGGKTIYYVSNRATSSHIWRVAADGGNPEQLTFSDTESELYPQLSPDGAWLYFIGKKPNSSAVWRKSLTGEGAEKLTDESALAPDTFLSLSPDGKYLAFQNLTRNSPSEKTVSEFRVGVLQTDNPTAVRFFEVPTVRQFIRWAADEAAFDYVLDAADGARIRRQPLDEKIKPALIYYLPKENIFDFAWSPDGRQLAVARGQLLRDVVLLTGFGE